MGQESRVSCRSGPAPKDAISLLKADHKAVAHLFVAYDETRSVASKKALVAEICTTLSVQAQIKEEIFYPELKAALKDRLLVHEATAEHASARQVMAQLGGCQPDEGGHEVHVKVLWAYMRLHVKQAQSEMFVKARNSSLDLDELGARMAARRDDLLAKAA
jgi:hypothetical protein